MVIQPYKEQSAKEYLQISTIPYILWILPGQLGKNCY